MTKQLTYTGIFKTGLLHEELLAAFPGWTPNTSDNTSRLQSNLDATEVYLFVPDAAEEEAIETVILAHDPEAPTVNETLRSNIRNIAQGAAGVRLNDLTATQSRALVAVMLWKAGGVAPDMTVRPLGDWT